METPASLLERLRRPADPEAWARFVALYTPLLYRWARRAGLQEADAAFDSEENHRYCRQDLGVRSTVIPLNRRRGRRKRPRTRYRAQMVRRFRKRPRGRRRRVYGQRWQAESAFSRHKRLLDSALRGKSEASREREC